MSVTAVYGEWAFPKRCFGFRFCRFHKTHHCTTLEMLKVCLQGFPRGTGDNVRHPGSGWHPRHRQGLEPDEL